MQTADPGVTRPSSPALKDVAALGDGRSVAIIGPGGALVWWCVPDLDHPPLFDQLLDPVEGGHFTIAPADAFEGQQQYRANSNVLETRFVTATGSAKLTESMNSGSAGRLPWCELARRVDGVEGRTTFRMECTLGMWDGAVSPAWRRDGTRWIFSAGDVEGALLTTQALRDVAVDARRLSATFSVERGERVLFAIVAGRDQPLIMPDLNEIDDRIDMSDAAWRLWSQQMRYEGDYSAAVRRSALALKLLLFSPSGAIAAAATSSLPERIGGNKNWDYRYAWIRDAAFTLDAFQKLGFLQECAAAFAWLIGQVAASGARVCYTLRGEMVPPVRELGLPGYRASRPVVVGNAATDQHQHGIYADLIEMAVLLVHAGHRLDERTARTLELVADECAARWREKDSGIWELSDLQHYTLSKISAWQALDRAIRLAREGHIDAKSIGLWTVQRDNVAAWVAENCWCESKQAYSFYAGTDRLDASLARAVLVGFGPPAKLHLTCDAIRRELARGALVYRYSGSEEQEGAFLACSFWLVEALSHLGRRDEASALMADTIAGLDGGARILSEMIDVSTGAFLGNLPQGLSHLSLINAACALHQNA